tara:strand:+ start:2347 stop:3234 length:888 start_codon:yes stop_codon:yes gene_type:complete
MSLYDKYHSKHNKDYMYNLITNIIQKENNIDMKHNDIYNQFFETNFINTFRLVDTEELTDLNKHLLDKQIEYFNNFISKQSNYKEKEEIVQEDELTNNTLIHSFNRNINLKNSSRHNFRISNSIKDKTCQLDKVILPIEDSSLFMNPTIIICLDTNYIELHLRGTMKLRDREYGLYTPFYENNFTLSSDTLRIQFKNQLYSVNNYCDVYKIIEYKGNIITIECDDEEFKEGDFIRICNFQTIDLQDDICLKKQYKIQNINQNKNRLDLTINNCKDIMNGLYIMNMSLQNSIHISY